MSAELKPCPFCGGHSQVTKGHAVENVWAHGVFYRVYCTACQLRQLFYRTEQEAIDAWNRRVQQPDSERDAALKVARAWIVKNRPAITLSRQCTVDEYMALLATIDAAMAAQQGEKG